MNAAGRAQTAAVVARVRALARRQIELAHDVHATVAGAAHALERARALCADRHGVTRRVPKGPDQPLPFEGGRVCRHRQWQGHSLDEGM
jgi:hypothetical protein